MQIKLFQCPNLQAVSVWKWCENIKKERKNRMNKTEISAVKVQM